MSCPQKTGQDDWEVSKRLDPALGLKRGALPHHHVQRPPPNPHPVPGKESRASLALESFGENYAVYDFCGEPRRVRILRRERGFPSFGWQDVPEQRTHDHACDRALLLFVRTTKQRINICRARLEGAAKSAFKGN